MSKSRDITSRGAGTEPANKDRTNRSEVDAFLARAALIAPAAEARGRLILRSTPP
jgi:hypothetical protein